MSIGHRFVTLIGCTLLLFLPAHRYARSEADLLREIRYDHRFLAGEPQVAIQRDGWVEVRLQTRVRCLGGEAYLGIFPTAATLSYPIYRINSQVICEDSLTIRANFDLKELEIRKNDINDLRGNRGGEIALRLQLFGERMHIIDRRFAYYRSTEGSYYRAAALVEGPFVDCVTDTGAVISFDFDLPVRGKLEISSRPTTYEFATPGGHLEIPVGSLAADSQYTYEITWTEPYQGVRSRPYSFRTALRASSATPFRAAILCDSRGTYGGAESDVEGVNVSVLKPLLNLAYVQNASCILFPGDLVSGSTSSTTEIEAQFRSWKRVTQPVGSRIPIYVGMGNHDQPSLWIEGGSDSDYVARSGAEAGEVLFARHVVNPTNGPSQVGDDAPPFQETVYSFDWGNAHFIMLNSNYWQKGSGEKVADLPGQLQGAIRPEQLEWLERDLKQARERGQEHLFVLSHEPAFPNGGHSQDGMWWNGQRPEIVAIRDRFWKTLCKYEVTAAFFGHEHNYSRTLIDSTVNPEFSRPIWQLITGGAGAPFYARDTSVPWANAVRAFYPLPHLCLLDVDGESVWLTVLSQEGMLVERVKLSLSQH